MTDLNEEQIGASINDGRADVAGALVATIFKGHAISESKRTHLEREIVHDPYCGVEQVLRCYDQLKQRMKRHGK